MHPKEFKRTKNGTGHFTNLSLKNCEMHVGIDFSQNKTINKIIDDPLNVCYVLYPSTASINLNETYIGKEKKNTVIFLIDATWPCSKAMLRVSPNLNSLQKISFRHRKVSHFTFKQQPEDHCLSTMESTLCVLELLNAQNLEQIDKKSLDDFLLPFENMIKYQLSYV
jgi:DTW domain-containing protein YfiP